MKLTDLFKQLNLNYKPTLLIENAFIHSTYINEGYTHFTQDYQRLEFMGDAVLQLVTAQFLYQQNPSLSEGQMTLYRASLVSEKALAEYSNWINLSKYIRLGQGEIKQGALTRSSLLADIFESFIGALYLEYGLEAVLVVIEQTIVKKYQTLNQQNILDYKTKLQELVQTDTRKAVSYKEISRTGPANDLIFESVVLLDGVILGKGKGKSKKQSEQEAAKNALEKMVK